MSAANINRVTITGNLTKDPELRTTREDGPQVCEMRIAVNGRRKSGEEWVDRPNYFDVAVWGGLGKLCKQYLSRGRGVAIDGRLEWSEWKTKEGANRQSVQIVADTIQFFPRPQQPKDDEANAGDEPAPSVATTDAPADSSGFEAPPAAMATAGASDDDIPF